MDGVRRWTIMVNKVKKLTFVRSHKINKYRDNDSEMLFVEMLKTVT